LGQGGVLIADSTGAEWLVARTLGRVIPRDNACNTWTMAAAQGDECVWYCYWPVTRADHTFMDAVEVVLAVPNRIS
jgi:hypothetical protein